MTQKIKELLAADNWPLAVDPGLICDKSAESQIDRMKSILTIIVRENLSGKNFLDFGCGDGYSNVVAKEMGAIPMGYDIVKSDAWGDNPDLTTDWSMIAQKQFNVILLYDVLDHCEDPIDVLNKCKSVMGSGRIYCRTHPFCSRHGGHLYLTLNKAYAHLLLDDQELAEANSPLVMPMQRVLYPIKTYTAWFGQAGLKILNRSTDTVPAEPIFRDVPELKSKIMSLWPDLYQKQLNKKGATPQRKYPDGQLAMSFVDFVLTI